MPIRFACPVCKKVYKAPDEDAGKKTACKRCGTILEIPESLEQSSSVDIAPPPLPKPLPNEPPNDSASGSQRNAIGPPINFLCPGCRSKMRIGRSKAGSEIRCPQCFQRVIVPIPADEAREGILISPENMQAPLPLPDTDDYDPSGSESDDDYELYSLRRRRRQRLGTLIWRTITLAALSLSFLCFFLPWVRYSIIIPANPVIRQDRFEFASQSGLQVAIAFISVHPALERWLKTEWAKQEAEMRKLGKNPFDEWLKKSEPYRAPWLLLFPLAIAIAALLTIATRPTIGASTTISVVVLSAAFLLLIQFGGFGPPAVNAFYDAMLREGDGPEGALLMSLLLDVHYTPWFTLAVAGLVVVLLTQGVSLSISIARGK